MNYFIIGVNVDGIDCDLILGLVGGARASVQLRSFLAALGCISVSMMFNISNAHLALTEDGDPSNREEVINDNYH